LDDCFDSSFIPLRIINPGIKLTNPEPSELNLSTYNFTQYLKSKTYQGGILMEQSYGCTSGRIGTFMTPLNDRLRDICLITAGGATTSISLTTYSGITHSYWARRYPQSGNSFCGSIPFDKDINYINLRKESNSGISVIHIRYINHNVDTIIATDYPSRIDPYDISMRHLIGFELYDCDSTNIGGLKLIYQL
jgi:hypothetical protein